MRYALIGGSGSVGQALAPVLKQQGHQVRILGRDTETSRALFDSDVEFDHFDVNNPSQGVEPLNGVDTIVYLVGVPYNEFKLLPEQTKIALKAAEAADVHRFILLSSLYSYGLPRTPLVDETHPREPNSFKGRMRKEQEDLILAAHTAGKFEVMVIRSPDFYGPTTTNSFMKEVFSAALEDRRANVIAPADTLHDFIFLPDLAQAIAQLSVQSTAYGQEFNVTGIEPISTEDFADQIFSQVGRPTKLFKAGKLLLRARSWQDPIVGEIVEMHYLWTTPVLLDDAKAQALIPKWQKTPLDEAIKLTLAQMKTTD